MRKAVLVSFFNSTNLGDLLLSDCLRKQIEREYVVTAVDFCSQRIVSNPLSALMNYSDLNSVVGDTNESIVRKRLIELVGLMIQMRSQNWKRYAELLDSCALVFIGGGNMLMDRTCVPTYTTFFYRFVKLARKKKKKVVCLNVGAGPLTSGIGRYFVRKSIKMTSYTSARDESSKNLVGISEVSCDIAFLLNKMIKEPGERYIALSVIHLDDMEKLGGYMHYIEETVRLARELSKTNEVVLFSTELRDYYAIDDVFARIDDARVSVKRVNSLKSLLELYADTKLLIGTRMHSIIIAMTQEIPTMALSWDKKVESLFEMAGITDALYRISDKSLPLERITGMIDCVELEANRRKVRSFVKRNRDRLENEFLDVIKG